jgi:hypothetical protein
MTAKMDDKTREMKAKAADLPTPPQRIGTRR